MNPKYWPEATTDAKGNLKLSAGYMWGLLNGYGGDYQKALAAYNFGPANVNNLIQKHGCDWPEHLPEETQKYIRWIMEGGDGNE